MTLESAVYSNGGDFLDTTKTQVTVDDPKFVEALQYCADLALVHNVAPNAQQTSSLGTYDRFINGELAMFWMGPWDQPAFWELPFEWDLMPAPVSEETGVPATWVGTMSFAISANSKHKQEAFDLATYLSLDAEGQKANMEMGQAVPNLTDMATSDYMNMDKAPKNKQVFIDIIQSYGRIAPEYYTYSNEWRKAFDSELNKVWTGEMTAQEYCKYIKPKMQKVLDKAIEQSKK